MRFLKFGIGAGMVVVGILHGGMAVSSSHKNSGSNPSNGNQTKMVTTVTMPTLPSAQPTTVDQTTCQLCHRLCAQHAPLCRRFCRDNEQCGEDPIAYCREQHAQCDQDCTNYECPQEDE